MSCLPGHNAPESRVEHVNIAEMVMDRLALGVYTTSSAATVWYKLEHSVRADILLVEDLEQLDKVTMMELLLSILNNFIQKGDEISFIVVDSVEKNSLQLLATEVLTEAKKTGAKKCIYPVVECADKK